MEYHAPRQIYLPTRSIVEEGRECYARGVGSTPTRDTAYSGSEGYLVLDVKLSQLVLRLRKRIQKQLLFRTFIHA